MLGKETKKQNQNVNVERKLLILTIQRHTLIACCQKADFSRSISMSVCSYALTPKD